MIHHEWNGIHYIEEFIEPSDLATVRQFIDSSEFGRQEGTRNAFIDGFPDPVSSIINDAQSRLQAQIEKDFSCTLGQERQGTIVRYDLGWVLPLHYDIYDRLPTYGGFPTRDLSSIMYLSTDFVGGDLAFPLADIVLHPSAGSVVYFPSSEEYQHEVTELISGNRYTCTSFWHILERH